MEPVARQLHEHYVNFPEMEIQDAVKFLYQRFLGPGHLISDEAAAHCRLRTEWEAVPADADAPLALPLGNGLCRLNLSRCKAEQLSVYTIARLFILTARQVVPDREGFARSLEQIRTLPFPPEQVDAYLADYRAQGCPMVGHSDRFRRRYRPAYRIVSEYYVNIIPLLAAIDRALARQPRLRVAIDGPCASGKTTLGRALADVYRCPLIHMDDFFLRPEQRTPERLAQPGGNVDYERFSAQVLNPLLAGQTVRYRPWNCAQGRFDPEVTVPPAPLTVVEGSYALRPGLREGYPLRVWTEACWPSRRERLLARGGPECLERFERLWIPLEDRYFAACAVSDCCQLRLDLS